MRFWQEDDPHVRLQMIRNARNGGSITPPYAKLLRKYQEDGVLKVITCAEVTAAEWCADASEWNLTLHTRRTSQSVVISDGDITPLKAHHIISATGSSPSFDSLHFLRSFLDVHPQPSVGGLPLLDENLQLAGWPLFFVGGYSALQVGPGAFNLEGMRAAADRVALRLENLNLGTEYITDGAKRPGENEEARRQRTSQKGRDKVEKVTNDFTYFEFETLEVDVET
jgi:hypothetical protein